MFYCFLNKKLNYFKLIRFEENENLFYLDKIEVMLDFENTY